MAHAILSPSSASRWLACTPSARLEEKFPDKSGEAAKEGTVAHELAELLLRKMAGVIPEARYEQVLATIKESKYYDAAMQEHCEQYATHVMEAYNEALSHTADALLFIEERIDLTEYVPEGFGTGDAIIIANGVLTLKDLKYGKGVPVSAESNKQMMLYGLGALHKFGWIYGIDTVELTIYQPRIDNISTWSVSVAALKAWAETELRPKAKMAFDGEGDFIPGEHCRFCKAKAQCRANAEENLKVAQYEFRDGELLNDEEIADILSRADRVVKWLGAVEDFALDQAVNHGKKWPGYKLVEGKSNRKYTDAAAVVKALTDKGYVAEKLYKPQEVIGITDMEKMLGKAKFKEYLGELVIKPKGALALVPLSHKSPEYNSVKAHKMIFKKVNCKHQNRKQNAKHKTGAPDQVITGVVRLSYFHGWEPVAIQQGQEPKFSTALIIKKSDKATVDLINKAVEAAIQEGISKWGGKKPAKLKLPLRDGDEEKPDDENYKGCFFLNASSKQRPGIIGPDKQEVMNRDEVYSGCYCKLSISFYPFDTNGNRGIAVSLNNIMKVKDGDPLSGRASAEDDFADVEAAEVEDIL